MTYIYIYSIRTEIAVEQEQESSFRSSDDEAGKAVLAICVIATTKSHTLDWTFSADLCV